MRSESRIIQLVPVTGMFAMFEEDVEKAIYRSEPVTMIGLTQDGETLHAVFGSKGLEWVDSREDLQGFSSVEASTEEFLPDGKAKHQLLTPEQIKSAANHSQVEAGSESH